MRRSGLVALTVAAVTAVAGAATIPVFARTAQAAASLVQVTAFGSNPGALNMYSYLPTSLPTDAPLVVALHGCTQSASDYYSHSGWSKYADMWGFAVVFPEQPSSSDPIMKCFDWGTPANDSRGQGEALSIFQMVQYAESHYGIDPHRVYITGLSAGAGMAADLLADYPDVFAAGSIDSGPPAQCSTTGILSSRCTTANTNDKTPAQWGDLVRNSDPGYTGPWPRIAIWQGTSDTTVQPVAMTESRDQWTNVWGISQRPSSQRTLPGATTLSIYNDATGKAAVETYSISGMAHGLAVNPGSGRDQCGTTATYYLDFICSSYYTARFFGLDDASPAPGPTTTPSPTTSPSPTTGPSAHPCFTDNNYNQTVAGRAHESLGYAYANGSNQPMGLWNSYIVHTLKQTGADYYMISDGDC
jgi:poly(hydroxyalkanoate) depolymerase family esterase